MRIDPVTAAGTDPLTRAGALAGGAARLAVSSPSARLDAELLLLHVLDIPRAMLAADSHARLGAREAVTYLRLVNRRALGEPVAYLLGAWGFWDLDLLTTSAALIPRPDTECLVERALQIAGPSARVLDLGTGCGAIALAMAHALPGARVTAVERSPAAGALARRNAARLDLGNVDIELCDWSDLGPGRHFDLVVSNPPYVASGDPHLRAGDLRFEPGAALGAGPDGFDAIDSLLPVAHAALAAGGVLLVEHGHAQGEGARSRFAAAGFSAVRTHRDLAGHERVTEGQRPGGPVESGRTNPQTNPP